MLKSSHSPDPLASWVTCVLLCASCLPHVGLTDHTWRTAFHMFASCPTHVRSLASPFPHGRIPYHTVAVLILLQTHINFPRFLPIFPDFLE
jgi:hypothetical protein